MSRTAARENAELFPDWKAALGKRAYMEMGEPLEVIEHRTFGGDGFDDALERIVHIDAESGLATLSTVTVPLPPAHVVTSARRSKDSTACCRASCASGRIRCDPMKRGTRRRHSIDAVESGRPAAGRP